MLLFYYYVSVELSAACNSDANEALRLSPGAQAHAYLLASTLVWAAPALQKLPAAEALLTAAQSALQRIVALGWQGHEGGEPTHGAEGLLGAHERL